MLYKITFNLEPRDNLKKQLCGLNYNYLIHNNTNCHTIRKTKIKNLKNFKYAGNTILHSITKINLYRKEKNKSYHYAYIYLSYFLTSYTYNSYNSFSPI